MTDIEPLDIAAKERVKQAARQAQLAEAAAATAQMTDQRTAAEIDPGTAYSIDDLSQSDDEGGWVEEDHAVGDAATAAAAVVDALDVRITDTVRPGAVVAFAGDRYLVGAPAGSFTVDGVEYDGIAEDAPIWSAIADRRQGETFTFNGRDHTIDLVC